MTSVTLLGTGIMGKGIAANLLKRGFDVTVYNRTREKAEPLAEQGAKIVNTPREAAANADFIISMVGDDTASQTVWLGEDGALVGAKPGTLLIECSTLSPDWVRELAAAAQQAGLEFMDSPVAGSKNAAADGQLMLFIGGDQAVIDRARPVLEAFSRGVARIGPTGSGAVWKLINNMMAAAHMAVLSEGLTLAQQAGIDMKQVAELILNGPTASGMVQGKLSRMLEHRYDNTDFSLRWMHKDVHYAVNLAESLGLELPTIETVEEVYNRAMGQGFDDADTAAVIEGIRKQVY